MQMLESKITQNNVHDDKKLRNKLKQDTALGTKDATVNDNDREDDTTARLKYIITDLLSQGKGSVFCKACSKEFKPSELSISKDSPFRLGSIDSSVLKKLKKEFEIKGRLRLPRVGYTVVTCSRGHELLRSMDWIT
jgi:hypothetical protein